MANCRDCNYFSKQQGYKLIYDGYCTMLKSGNSYKGVNYSGSCNYFSGRNTSSNSGYKGGGCFLTSACTEFLGKPDDCEELTKLRAFRDNYMKSSESGKKLVEEYYRVAPKIVDKINASENKNKYYSEIYKTILQCLAEIDRCKNDEALKLYKQMVNKFKKQFSL